MIYRRVLSLSFGVLIAIALVRCVNGQTTDQSATNVEATASSTQISISITQPTYGFNVLPGSVRRIFATVVNGKTNAIAWSVTGGAKLSSSTGNWVDVTAPETGSKCSIQGEEK